MAPRHRRVAWQWQHCRLTLRTRDGEVIRDGMRTCTRLGPRPPPRPAPSVGQPHPPCCLGDALPQWHPRAPLPGWQPAEEKHACGSAVRVGKSNAPTHTHPRTRRNDACARNGLCLGPPSMAASTPGQLDRPVLGTHDVPPPTAHVSRNLTDRSRHATRTQYGREWGKSSLLTAQGGVCRWAVHHPPAKAQPPGPGHPQAPALQQPESGGHKTEVSRGTEMTVSTPDQAPWKRAPPSPEVFEPSSRA